MNKLFLITLLSVCIISAQAFVKRDAPAPADDVLTKLQKQFSELTANVGEKVKEAMDPETLKKNFNEFVDKVNDLKKDLEAKKQ